MNKRHIHNHGFRLIVAVILMILMMAGHASAQVKVKGNVYGGGNLANVGQSVTVNVKGGEVEGDVYGGGALANTNTANWDDSANSGAGSWADGKTSATNTTAVNLTGGTIKGDAFGGGLGRLANGNDPSAEDYLPAVEAKVYGDVLVTVAGTKMVTGYTTGENPVVNAGRVFGANNINGTPKGHVKVLVQKTAAVDGQSIDVAAVFGGGNQAAYNPYSNMEEAEVEVNMTAGDNARLIVGNVFGGGNEAGTENTAGTDVKIINGNVKTGVYGGCNTSGTVSGDTKVAITGGMIGTDATHTADVFGGGLGHQTLVNGNVTVELGAKTAGEPPTLTGDATIYGDVYGGSAKGIVNATATGSPGVYSATAGKTTNVAFYSGTLNGNLYGGGLGDATHAADVYGNITVNIGTGTVDPDTGFADDTDVYGNATINGSIYGCNNTNGTPKGDVTVNIWNTAHTDANAYPTENDDTDDDTEVNKLSELAALVAHPELGDYSSKFAITAVYGGGNQAAYDPTIKTGDNANRAMVHVYACKINTIKTVYGGGNAADATNVGVIIDGGFFDRVFGGGNGYSATNNHTVSSAPNYNPGANISGSANTQIHGGLFRQLFGGSNQYGNVNNANLSIDNASGCTELINESFGGANQAKINGHVTTTLTCSGNMEVANFYGGSNEADIEGSVTLNVYGGHFLNVFGGSKGIADDPETQDDESVSADITGNVTLNLYGGTIDDNAYGGSNIKGSIGGKITVNVLNNNGTCNLSIGGNIYGAGNETPYAPNYDPADFGETERISPVVNLIHGTVANVFGGAKGATATVTASPQVNIGYDATTMGDLATSGTLLYNLTQDTDNYKSTTATAPADFAAVVTGNVYGGGDEAQVVGNTTVNLRKSNSTVDYIFGGGNKANVTHNSTVNIIDGTVGHDVYGGGALADVGTNGNDATQVNLTGGTINGDAYGGGLGRKNDPDPESNPDVEAKVYGDVTVTLNGTKMVTGYTTGENPVVNAGRVFGANNINGTPKGHVKVVVNKTTAVSDQAIDVAAVFGGGNQAAYEPTSSSDFTEVEINMTSGVGARLIVGNVFGGGNEAGTLNSAGTEVKIMAGDVKTAVFGGCNTSGTVSGTATVTVMGGTLGTAFASAPASMDAIPNVLFGGGKGANTAVTGKTTLNVGTISGSTHTGAANIYGNVYGGSENGTIGDVDVNLYANKIYGNVFGGGYDTHASLAPEGTLAKHAPAAGVVNVLLNGTEFDRTYTNNTYMAQVFGCNNKNGTPTGLVTVHVKRTIGCDKSDTTTPIAGRTAYDVYAVYGGGNMADYKPSGANDSTFVLIEGCDLSSIQYVYGGGNAAAVPASGVSIKGTYIIDKVFGGGNGAGQVPGPNNTLIDNPGANVGYYIDGSSKPSYGRGRAVTKLYGGTINEAYGGSNTLGDVRKVIVETKTPEGSTPDCCTTLNVNNVYGAGSEAEMTGDVNIIMECMPEDYVEAVYGGAKNAVINGNVMLVVTSGKYGRVFGGNNAGGSINGTISVVAKEEGCKPLEIGELYGGGNQAPYSKYGCEKVGNNWVPNTSETEGAVDHTIPTGQTTPAPYAIDVLVESCTSIGKVFGGGNLAEVIGDTHVEINMFRGTTDDAPNTLRNLGRIGHVFGGGNLAKVTGKTTVDIGTDGEQKENGVVPEGQKKGVNIISSDNDFKYINPDYDPADVVNKPERISITAGIYGGGNAADVDGDTEVNIGTANQSLGINITADIFGGGLGETTTVTGNVTVNIGGQDATTNDYVGYANITGDVYGGSAKGKVNATKSGTAPNITYSASSGTTSVNLYGCTSFNGNLYGGGLGDNTYAADVYGPVTVNVYGGTANNVFGCNNVNGAPQSTVTVTMNGGTINNSIYGGGNQAAYSVENNPNKDQANAYKKYPVVNINNGTVTGNVFGGGYGLTATVTGSPQVTIGDNVNAHAVAIGESVYGGGELAGVDYDTNIRVLKGAIGDANGVNAGERYGNVYGAGKGALDNVEAGIVKGNTNISISGGNIYHNIYGGGAYGSVGTITRGAATYVPGKASVANMPTSWVRTVGSETGKATITITGGTIGINGHENGMVYGSSRGNVATPEGSPAVDPNDRLAWVYETEVIIGTVNDATSGPTIKGSVYGSGENGHVYHDTDVKIHSGIIGITDTDGGAAFNKRGNVYGGGCGEDTFKVGDVDTYNPLAGIVLGTANVTMDGGHVVHNVYGAGAMGSVGTMTTDNNGVVTISSGGSTSITISGGTIGVSGSVGDGNVFGAARGDVNSTQTGIAQVKTTNVTISQAENSTTIIKGNVYGGGEIGDVQGNAVVAVQGGSVAKNVFGGGKGDGGLYDCSKAMVGINDEGACANPGTGGNENKGTKVTISNGTIGTLNNGNLVEGTGNVYGGGEIGRVEWNTQVEIGVGDGNGPFEPYIYGNVFGAGKGMKTHGYSALVRGNSTVTVQGDAKIGKDVYGGGEISTVGRYWVKGIMTTLCEGEERPDEPIGPKGMPYLQRSGGVCSVTVQGNAVIGYNGVADDAGHVFGAGKGVDSPYVPSGQNKSQKMTDDQGLVDFVADGGKTAEQLYYEFLETLALVTNSFVTIDGSAQVNGNVYGGSESGFVQTNTNVTIQGGTIGTSGSTTYGNVFGGGKGLPTFAEAGKVKGATSVAISGGTTNGNVYGGGQLGYVQQNVAVTVSGGQVVNDVYGGGALADTNTDNWDATANSGAGGWAAQKNDPSTGTTYKTTVTIIGGTLGNAYGGGLGYIDASEDRSKDIAAMVYGDVAVTINKSDNTGTAKFITASVPCEYDKTYKDTQDVEHTEKVTGAAYTKGRVFGANNINGTPKGNVTVTVWSTTPVEGTEHIYEADGGQYEIQGVYGGGNLADYVPATGKETHVNIHGCGETSIQYVFGGGNAAKVPETHVDIYGTFEIEAVFGGGNGNEPVYSYTAGQYVQNPGAEIMGDTHVILRAGLMHQAFGGSFERGIIHGTTNLEKTGTGGDGCALKITDMFGGGKDADVNGVNIILSECTMGDISGAYYEEGQQIENVYAGSYNARIFGDVTMTVRSGNFKNVFGGNYSGGFINGNITINIEETENCKPIRIGNLYGGGNYASYPGLGASISKGKIEINVKACTSIGNIYGGSFHADVDADTEININMIKGWWAGKHFPLSSTNDDDLIPDAIGTIGNVFGGGNEGELHGTAIVNIGNLEEISLITTPDNNPNEANPPVHLRPNTNGKYDVLGANITGDVYGGGNKADITGNTYVNICAKMGSPVLDANDKPTGAYTYTPVAEGTSGVKIGGSVYGGGCEADVLSNTFVRMSDGYVFNGIFGGGYSGSVGTVIDRSLVNYDGTTHTSHTGCLGGKPKAFADNTGKCTVVVNGGQIGPVDVAVDGMNAAGGPNPHGWVWGGGCGLIEGPEEDPDADFRTYVKETDVTIGGTAFIMEGVIGGGEFGRVLDNTKVTITGNCQIGVGNGKYNKDGNNIPTTPIRYTAEQWASAAEAVTSGNASAINTAAASMPECSHFPYQSPYLPYDPYFDKYHSPAKFAPASTANPSDGKTWIGVVFGGGSGYMPYEKEDRTGYDWCRSAGLVEGDATVEISGGHILTNVYGGNEYTDVKGKCTVTMTGGTIGVPRTLEQIKAHPVTCYLFGAGKGDERSHFYNMTNVGSVEVNVSGGIIYGSVFGGSEDGHVLGDVKVNIQPGAVIGTWGTSYVDGNVFGGGRGFSGTSLTAGNVGGNVTLNIEGGTMLGSIYGGGRLGSVGYDLVKAKLDNGSDNPAYGTMLDGDSHGHVTINITGGTIGNDYENIIPSGIENWTNEQWQTWKNNNHIPQTEFVYDNNLNLYRLSHTKGGNVFAGGMGRLYALDGSPLENWFKLGKVKSTKLKIEGGTIKSNVYGGGEIGWTDGYHTSSSTSREVSTEILISNGTIGREITDGSGTTGTVKYTFGSVFGGGYGDATEKLTKELTNETTWSSYPKFQAGRVVGSTQVKMRGGTVLASIYGGGEVANVGYGFYSYKEDQSTNEEPRFTLDAAGIAKVSTYVDVTGGTIGHNKVSDTYFGGATMGNVYGGGSGNRTIVRCGLVLGNTNVNISGSPTIYHNVYGGGSYGTVGDFDYKSTVEDPNFPNIVKVSSVEGIYTTGTGIANVTITGGTFGIDGHNNGMVFGSSRGDVTDPAPRDDYMAWVYDTHVTIGDGTNTPQINGSVYGSGENGHTFNNTYVTVHSGTIGVVGEPNDANRGNVYGSGCGSDKYDSDNNATLDMYKPLAGIVLGNTNITIDGGKVVHNVYGGGSMGSVGKSDNTGVITSGGKATITISGGQIGENGTGNGNVFGAARGDEAFTTDGYAQVKTTEVNINAGADVKGNVFGGGEAGVAQVDTHVNMSGGTVALNVYGGGYLGNVGIIDKLTDPSNYKWTDSEGHYNNTGICHVTITGGTVGSIAGYGNVFGAGKGSGVTFQCENAMVYDGNVTVSNGTVNGNVYGGGEVGRVENNTTVNIGSGTGEGPFVPDIKGSVFGGGKGLETHGYSALTRGNTEVTVQGNAQVAKNVYGGGEIASVGRYGLNAQKMPNILLAGGECKVTVKGNAIIGPTNAPDKKGNVFGGGKGVETPYYASGPNRSKRMVTYDPTREVNPHIEGNKGTFWDPSDDPRFVWEYFIDDETKTGKEYYNSYLETLALTTAPDVTIDGNATINGSVFGGGELGITKGDVTVTIKGGTMQKDVYGGGALSSTNTVHEVGKKDSNGNLLPPNAQGVYDIDIVHPITNVYLLGGLINGDAYGGGLGQLEVKEGETVIQEAIEAKTFGEINVYLGGNKEAASASATAFNISYLTDDTSKRVVNSARVFGCNNRNGSPQEDVTVTVWKTRKGNSGRTRAEDKESNKTIIEQHPENYASIPGFVTPTYELAAVYGGGNLASFTAEGKKTHVIIHGCDATSIETVYGGGNAAAVPETSVDVYSCYEIGSVFGGGNGSDKYTLDNGDHWVDNPGANVNGSATTMLYGGTIHKAYGGSNQLATITGSVFIDVSGDNPDNCDLVVDEIVGAGKNADVNGDLIVIMGCKPETRIPVLYGGANNANVKGNVELTITSGTFGKVFGGNNLGGAIKGHIKLNIEETSCTPIIIEELYLSGNEAAYSKYGYYQDGVDANSKPILKPRTAEMHAITDTSAEGYKAPHDNPSNEDGKHPFPYAEPELNIISCTSIGEVFGGGLGEGAAMYANPTVNINMIPGSHASKLGGLHKLGAVGSRYKDMHNEWHEGGVFGGGNEATVYGNTTVNIGTVNEVYVVYPDLEVGTNVKGYYTYNNGEYELITTDTNVTAVAEGDPKVYYYSKETVEGANIVSNVYGGGNLADVTGNTYVNICAVNSDDPLTPEDEGYSAVSFSGLGYEGVTINGNVFGGGKGIADSFMCAKGMVGKNDEGKNEQNPGSIDKGTRVNIGNGTINGNVYGGGEIGRVEWNTLVKIGFGDGTENGTLSPVIEGNVFGAGKGLNTHGYSALVRGDTEVTVKGNAWVKKSVYGGGEIASVGRYKVKKGDNDPVGAPADVEVGMPYKTNQGGNCTVIVQGYAEIGPNGMQMAKADGNPDDTGYVFGGGKGVLPYEALGETSVPEEIADLPRRITTDETTGDYWEYYTEEWYNAHPDDERGTDYEGNYLKYIETLALSTNTDVTVSGNAFVKGSVYGGSENGHVQGNTHVVIDGDCQIGCGKNTTARHPAAVWGDNYTPSVDLECASWPYGNQIGTDSNGDPIMEYLAYDVYKTHKVGNNDVVDWASDGHTFYGNVFGGGSGLYPYKQNPEWETVNPALGGKSLKDLGYSDGIWLRSAGAVYGNTHVEIKGGHILTNVYGGNECTDVNGESKVEMSGGTLGVPRSVEQIKAHPVTCYLFGAGKGDQRINFNTWTNVKKAIVNITGGRIYGSVFGGGEDGHVLEDVEMTIGQAEGKTTIIGTTGTSYVDGNIFGGGRGFSGVALTAGSTGGNVTMNIAGGTMLGSVYGGGRLASVGIDFTPATSPFYGLLVDDTSDKTHGHITINISGGTIGNGTTESGAGHPVSGNVFGGSMGRITLLDGSLNPLWPKQAVAKLTEVTVSGGTIYNSVYGGSEFGVVRNRAKVNVSGTADIRGNVFGGGYGSDKQDKTTIVAGGYNSIPTMFYTFTPTIWTGCVSGDTYVNISGGKVGKNVYGGGDMASVGLINYNSNEAGTVYNFITKHESLTDGFGLSWPYKFEYIAAAPTDLPAIGGGAVGGKATVTITGGRIGSTTGTGNVFGGSKGMVSLYKEDNTTLITDVNEQRYAEAFCANVRETEVNINYGSTPESDDDPTTECIVGAVYGGGQDGHVYEDAKVSITGGLIGLSVYGGGEGESTFLGKLRVQSTGAWKATTEPLQSITAGKVYGNTSVRMTDGLVVGHVYGGGNLASVGKGNYAGGADDYYPAGYGEKLTGNLWTPSAGFNPNAPITDSNKPTTMADYFLSSGNVTVSITGGQVGTLNGTSGTVFGTSEVTPTGMVFGGSRGRSAQDVMLDPRHEYAPDFYLGYVNTTSVTIGNASGGPRIYSQVFGGGRDGHVRNSAHVIINNGFIGQTYDETKDVPGSTKDYQLYHRGNVYGSGSGLGDWNTDPEVVSHGMSSGSVTRNTTVDINGGTIYNNVYGGGALSSVGPPKLDPEKGYAAATWSKCVVNINGGIIGQTADYESHQYGGCVYGASRGNDFAAGESSKDFATVLWTEVNIKPHPTDRSKDAVIAGNVYGGGATGDVKCNTDVSMTGGIVGHDVFGGGKGDGGLFDCSKAMVGIEGEGAGKEPGSDDNKDKGTSVTISNGTVNGNVYGGGEIGRVEWNTQVKIGVGTGDGPFAPVIEGSVFGAGKGLETHGYSALVRGNSTVTVQGAAKIGHNVYGGGEMATVGRYWVKGKNTTDPNTGEPFVAAKPIPEDLPEGMPYKQQSGGYCNVTIQGNAIIGPKENLAPASETAGHVFGAGQGVVPHFSDGPKRKVNDGDPVNFANETAYFEFLETLALVTNANVTIDGSAQVKGNVYGGSESGFVQHHTNVKVQNGTIGMDGSYGNVFGGGKGLSLSSTSFTEAGKVKENTRVDILGGTMYGDVYGGGALGKSNTAVDNGTYPTATVNLKGGTITGSAYGGGLGDATTAANVGNTVLHLNEGLETTTKGCIVKGYIFGCNNANGTPLGHALVHIHATQNVDKTDLRTKYPDTDAYSDDVKYDVKGVFGGGKSSDYVPAAKDSTEVIIEGCDLTSIEEVYGGGYGAAVPATEVLIKGTYIIDNVFGGGYGAGEGNPGANVGTRTGGGAYGETVTGKTHVKLMAGRIHHVYGASNTKGDILGGSSVTTVDKETPAGSCQPICENLQVDDIYGGGQDAPMEGGTEVVLGCMPNDWVDEVYAGAANANVGNDVMLTITSGKFGRVFGGNKSGGILDGGIVVNIEENPNCDTPIVIGELYGGGNMAPYSAYGYNSDGTLKKKGETGANATASPVVVHAKAFTSIGKIFGGGKGAAARLIGNPWVLVDEMAFDTTAPDYKANGYDPADDDDKPSWIGDGAEQVKLYPHENGEMGVVGTIFGGGNEAEVEGNTTVKIASYEYVVFWSAPELDDVRGFYTRTGEGTQESPYEYTKVEGAAAVPPAPGTLYFKKVQGADIRGNIYGGGNNAAVTGDTNVVIGRKAE